MTPGTPTLEEWTDRVALKLQARLADQELRLLPSRVEIHTETDLLGEDAWRLVLVLPAPDGDTWDRSEVFRARRTAIEVFDDLAAGAGHRLPGSTLASVTTDEAPEADVAPEDVPEEGEDPGREA